MSVKEIVVNGASATIVNINGTSSWCPNKFYAHHIPKFTTFAPNFNTKKKV